ncbi:MAG TPA: sulfatase [Candidatus Binatia bacterium]|nr:sulfatase [Candidatus Binatia bacterium]
MLLAPFLLAVAGCTSGPAEPAQPATPPSLVLISVDTLRADHLGTYGYGRATSPNIDALARDGVVFEHAYAPSSWTLPSHASMLSGASPYRHGAVTQRHAIRSDVTMLAERLHDRGYATAALVSAPFLGRRFGFARGFDAYEQHAKPRDAAGYQSRVLEVVRGLPREPFFLFVHYFDVHSPYDPEPEFNRFARDAATRDDARADRIGQRVQKMASSGVKARPEERDRLVDLYDGEILQVDVKIRELIDAVRARTRGRFVAVLTADHGEEFLEHGGLLHGKTLYDEVLHVPLVVTGEGVARGGRVGRQASLLDVAPTLLEFAGAPAIADVEGRSLAEVVRSGESTAGGARDPGLDLLTLANDGSVAMRGVRTPELKLIVDALHDDRRELYDLRTDPRESTNVYADRAPVRAEGEILARVVESEAPLPPIKRATARRLRSLGYM